MTLPVDLPEGSEWPRFRNTFLGPIEWADKQIEFDNAAAVVSTLGIGDTSANQQRAMSYTPSRDHNLLRVQASLQAVGSPTDDIICELRSDNAGQPSATVLGSVTRTAASMTFSGAGAGWFGFEFSPVVALTVGTVYWVVFRRSGAVSSTDYIRWASPNADTTAEQRGTYNGTSWTIEVTDNLMKIVSDVPVTRLFIADLDLTPANPGGVASFLIYSSLDGGHTWVEYDPHHRAFCNTVPDALRSASLRTYQTEFDLARAFGTQPLAVAERWSPPDGGLLEGQRIDTGATVTGGRSGAGPILSEIQGSDHVVVFQKSTELVMGTAYRRIGLNYRSSRPGAYGTTVDLISGTGSGAGTQVHYDLQALVKGSGDRLHPFWTQSDVAEVKTRVYKSDRTFTAIITPGSAACSNTTKYPIGNPCTYLDGANTMGAVPYVDGSAVKILRCDSATADIAGNWTVETAVAEGAEQDLSNPCQLMADVKKLWLWFVTADAERDIAYCHDQGVGQWTGRTLWKQGDTVKCGGISAAKITNAIGILYYDEQTVPARVRYDRLIVLQDKVGLSVGETESFYDFGVDDPGPHDIILDAGAGADPAGNVYFDLYTGPDGVSGWRHDGTVGTEASQSEGGAHLPSPMRHLKVVKRVENFASTAGVTGV